MKLTRKKTEEIGLILEKEGSNNTEIAALRSKVLAVWNSYLIGVRVYDATTKAPIKRARVEFHQVKVPNEGFIQRERSHIVRASPLNIETITDTEGRAYFGLPEQLLSELGLQNIIVVMIAGYEPQSRATDYGQIVRLTQVASY